MARQSKEVRQARAILTANKSLEQRLEKIDWEEDVLYPLLDKVKAGEISIEHAPEQLSLEVGDADPDQ